MASGDDGEFDISQSTSVDRAPTHQTSLALSRERRKTIHDLFFLHVHESPIPNSSLSHARRSTLTFDQDDDRLGETVNPPPPDTFLSMVKDEEESLLERCLCALTQLQARFRGWRLRRQAKKTLHSILLDHQDADLLDMFRTSVSRDSFELEYHAVHIQRRWRKILLERRYSRASQRIRRWIVKIMMKDREGLMWVNQHNVQKIFFIEFYVEEVKHRLEKICSNKESSLITIQPVSYLRSHIVRDPCGHLQQVYRRCKGRRYIPQYEWWRPLLSSGCAAQLQRLPHHLAAIPRAELTALRWRLLHDRDRYWGDSSAVFALECRDPALLYRITRDFGSAAVDIPVRYDFEVLPETAAVVLQKWCRGTQLRQIIKYDNSNCLMYWELTSRALGIRWVSDWWFGERPLFSSACGEAISSEFACACSMP